jgi:lipoyl(octanoyl) transferase
MNNSVCYYCFLGRIEYMQARGLQKQLAEAVAAGSPDILLLLEHPPTYTLGVRGSDASMRVPREFLLRQGAAVHDVDRGGDVTFHGPGQLVGYPVLNLAKLGTGIRLYLRFLEEVMIRALSSFELSAGRIDGYTGVWVNDEKIGAIGVKITSRRITQHGFALNANTDLSYFERIVPCGITDKGVTALSRILGHDVPLPQLATIVARQFGDIFQKQMVEIRSDMLPVDFQRASQESAA